MTRWSKKAIQTTKEKVKATYRARNRRLTDDTLVKKARRNHSFSHWLLFFFFSFCMYAILCRIQLENITSRASFTPSMICAEPILICWSFVLIWGYHLICVEPASPSHSTLPMEQRVVFMLSLQSDRDLPFRPGLLFEYDNVRQVVVNVWSVRGM